MDLQHSLDTYIHVPMIKKTKLEEPKKFSVSKDLFSKVVFTCKNQFTISKSSILDINYGSNACTTISTYLLYQLMIGTKLSDINWIALMMKGIELWKLWYEETKKKNEKERKQTFLDVSPGILIEFLTQNGCNPGLICLESEADIPTLIDEKLKMDSSRSNDNNNKENSYIFKSLKSIFIDCLSERMSGGVLIIGNYGMTIFNNGNGFMYFNSHGHKFMNENSDKAFYACFENLDELCDFIYNFHNTEIVSKFHSSANHATFTRIRLKKILK